MDTDAYTLTVTLSEPIDEAESRVRDALGEEGFGILSEIDVEATLRQKLGEEIGGYRILGACNPPLAHKAIAADRDVGALLPCNVLLRDNPDGGTDVAAADPRSMLAVADNEYLTAIAEEARERITRALNSLAS